MCTGDRGTLLTFPLMCFHGKMRIRLIIIIACCLGIEGLLDFHPSSADDTGLLVTGAARHFASV